MPTESDILLNEAGCLGCGSTTLDEMLEAALLGRILEAAPAVPSEVAAIVDSFVERSLITDQTQIDALTTLVTSARANGWWDLCDLIYPFVGGTAAAHAQNLKSSNFQIIWAGAVTHDANGVTGDGATGYGNPGYVPSSSGQMALNSVHTTVYTRVNGNSGGVYFGGTDGANNILYLACGQGNTVNEMAMAANCPVGDIAFLAINRFNGTLNLTAMDRYDAANVHGYSSEAAGVYGPMDQATAQASTGIQSTSAFILAYNNNGAAVLYQTANVAFLTAGASIGFALYQLMYADIEAFQTALVRQV